MEDLQIFKINKISTISIYLLVAPTLPLAMPINAHTVEDKVIPLKGNDLKIVFSDKEGGPLHMALQTVKLVVK